MFAKKMWLKDAFIDFLNLSTYAEFSVSSIDVFITDCKGIKKEITCLQKIEGSCYLSVNL